MISRSALTAILLAKRPEPGRVKTRLVRSNGLDAAGAAALGRAMLLCTLRRLETVTDLVVAVTPDGSGADIAADLGRRDLRIVDQGDGDLGQRLERLWDLVCPAGPVAFFGMDTPDVPDAAIAAIGPALREADLAIGPTEDGGFWTLAGQRRHPRLLSGIDWGTEAVYDQTCRRAASAGLTVRRLPTWRDVDEPEDVGALRRRLSNHLRRGPSGTGADPLRVLAEALDAVWARRSPATDSSEWAEP
ncbi:MAG: TIGR04282 family arsenosugar biosynthesis glycosyltransferase [Planctomycetota bacterium]|jgi:rSAM/selenodomain-associated transferase 1